MRPVRPVEAGPPREEHLGHEVEHQLLGLLGRVDGTEQARHLPERTKLEASVVQCCLALDENGTKLDDHGQRHDQWQRHAAKVPGDGRVGKDGYLGGAARELCHLDGLVVAVDRTHARNRRSGSRDHEPDLF